MNFNLDTLPDALAPAAQSPPPLHGLLPTASADALLWDAAPDFSSVPLSSPHTQQAVVLTSPTPACTAAMLDRANALDDVFSSAVQATYLVEAPRINVVQPSVAVTANTNDIQVPAVMNDIDFEVSDEVNVNNIATGDGYEDDDGRSMSNPVPSLSQPSNVPSGSSHIDDHQAPLTDAYAPCVSTQTASKCSNEKDNDDAPLHVEIDIDVVEQMGALAYAEFRKKRARELQKDARRREHYANGNLTNLIRIGKKDKSMSERQRYTRRLSKNQDSAAAARIAQKVFVGVLARLVERFEVDRRDLKAEVESLRATNGMMKNKMSALQSKVEELQGDRNNQLLNMMKADPIRAKYADMPSFVVSSMGAKAELGVQPAPAV